MAEERPAPVARGARVLVIGGGLAGMACACALADAGARVTVVERRDRLGGRAGSFRDPDLGLDLDLGQHLFLGCCDRYIAFLRRIGAWEGVALQRRMRVPLVGPGGKVGVLREAPLPPPLHLLPSFLAYPHLSPGEKARALPALRALARPLPPDEADRPFSEWLARRGQSERALHRLWEPIVLATLNERPDAVSTGMAGMVFRLALLTRRDGGRVGWPRRPLSDLVEGPVRRYLAERGGEVRTGTGIARLAVEGRRVLWAETGRGERLPADLFVLAVPWHAVRPLLPPAWREEPFFARLERLEGVPIVNLYLLYDRPVMREPFLGFVEGPLQFVFDLTRLRGLPGPPYLLNLTLSGAWDLAREPSDRLLTRMASAVAERLPGARTARLLGGRAVRQMQATFRPTPGANALRPPPETPLENLLLAGDWVDTGWPATMEGAVRGGERCARSALERLARPATPAPEAVG